MTKDDRERIYPLPTKQPDQSGIDAFFWILTVGALVLICATPAIVIAAWRWAL